MRMAMVASMRSTCQRSPTGVGAIITDRELTNVLSIGYNGPPKRGSNDCPNGPVEGACGCIHAEVNALLKAPWDVHEQVMFVTLSPCVTCARLILNSRITRVVYAQAYRYMTGIETLLQGGLDVVCLPISFP